MTTPKDLTLEEKASLTSGQDFWHSQGVERTGVPSLMLTDGPNGLRKQAGEADHLGLNASVPATCFPPAVGLGSSFDEELARRVGEAIGLESAIEDVSVVLGPGVNIKRSPLGGRNFEYISEDPLVAGVVATGLVRGIQSQGVGASLKHFAANNQEFDRMRVSSDIDPRPLHEIYLRAFERVVKDAQPWTVMCSYNKINGVYSSENPWLLTQLLRDDWGFEGLVVSDWGAVNDRIAALIAGMDLEMPGTDGATDRSIVAAVRDGSLDEDILDIAVGRMLDLVEKASRRPAVSQALDVDAHHALAREAAGRSMVLLRNEGDLLPLKDDESIAVIGEFARSPRFQGGGSSHINPTRLDTVVDAFGDRATFSPGYTLDGTDGASLRDEAAALAAEKDVAVVLLGLPESAESEGFDREHIELPPEQLELLDAVLDANPRTVVVLSNGSVVALPFADRVPAIVEGWLLGQAGGSATVDVLTGVVNPSGRLSETIPVRLEDTPAFGNFPGSAGHVRYGEGILVGYRWYDARRLEVTYPFGHGLSYTAFDYGAASAVVADSGDVVLTVPVTNTGARDGREVVQAYASPETSAVDRAPRELKGFASVALAAGETRDVRITIRREDLAYWDLRTDGFVVEGGAYRLEVGASSRDIREVVSIEITGDEVRMPLTKNSSIAEVLAHPVVGPTVQRLLAGIAGPEVEEDENPIMDKAAMEKMMASFPIGRLAGLGGMGVDTAQIEQLLDMAQAAEGPDSAR